MKVDLKTNLLIVKGTFAGPVNSFCRIVLNTQKKSVSAPDLYVHQHFDQTETKNTSQLLSSGAQPQAKINTSSSEQK